MKLAVFALTMLCLFNFNLAAEEKAETKKAATQQVGGLLFDVDEGVKVRQGAGGSVYLESNREYMQNKFETIDTRLTDLENRLNRLELALAQAAGAAVVQKQVENQAPTEDTRRVLVT